MGSDPNPGVDFIKMTGNNSKTSVSLKVSDGYDRDLYLGRVRINPTIMKSLDITTGDIIQIIGNKKTAAKCLPLFTTDKQVKTIRMDPIIRKNAGIELNQKVGIEKIHALDALEITLSYDENVSEVNESFLRDELEGIPVTGGDSIIMPYFGNDLLLYVVRTMPENDSVIVTSSTVFRFEKSEFLKSRGISK